MRWKLIVVFVLWASSSWADTHLLLWPYFPGQRYERAEEQELRGRTTWTSGVGYLVDDWYASLDSTRFETSNSEGNTSVKRKYQDIAVWAGKALMSEEKWRIHWMAGLGQYKETVKTRVGAVSDSDTSVAKKLFGIGAEWIFLDPATFLTFSFGGKFFWAEDFDPNPQPQLMLKVGIRL